MKTFVLITSYGVGVWSEDSIRERWPGGIAPSPTWADFMNTAEVGDFIEDEGKVWVRLGKRFGS
jgi:hypothetical protein